MSGTALPLPCEHGYTGDERKNCACLACIHYDRRYDVTPNPRASTRIEDSWWLAERYVTHADDWRLVFKRGATPPEVLEISVSEDMWRAFGA